MELEVPEADWSAALPSILTEKRLRKGKFMGVCVADPDRGGALVPRHGHCMSPRGGDVRGQDRQQGAGFIRAFCSSRHLHRGSHLNVIRKEVLSGIADEVIRDGDAIECLFDAPV